MRLVMHIVVEMMRKSLVGKRIRLNATTDPYTNLRAGDEGTVSLVDDFGTVHVLWDNGSSLGLIPEEDDWTVLGADKPDDPCSRMECGEPSVGLDRMGFPVCMECGSEDWHKD